MECGDTVQALNANVFGNGTETIVLAHGFGSDQTVWYYLIPYLACYFKVVLFDLVVSPNVDSNLYDPQRYSDFNAYAEDLVCLLDHLHLNNTIYVGHSMSAMVGCLASTNKPHLFQHLVLLSGSPRYLNDKGYNGGFERSKLESMFKQMEENFRNWVKNFSPTVIAINNTAAIAEFQYSLGRMKPNIAISVAKTVLLSDLRSVLPKVEVPSTIILSEMDPFVPKTVGFYMKKKLLGGHARIEILKTKGHVPQLTAYSMLLQVLKSLASSI